MLRNIVICNVHLEGRVQHGVWFEVTEFEPTASVKNRWVKFLVDAGFISARAHPGTRHV